MALQVVGCGSDEESAHLSESQLPGAPTATSGSTPSTNSELETFRLGIGDLQQRIAALEPAAPELQTLRLEVGDLQQRITVLEPPTPKPTGSISGRVGRQIT